MCTVLAVPWRTEVGCMMEMDPKRDLIGRG